MTGSNKCAPQLVELVVVAVAAATQAAVMGKDNFGPPWRRRQRSAQPVDAAPIAKWPWPELERAGVEKDQTPAVEIDVVLVARAALARRVYRLPGKRRGKPGPEELVSDRNFAGRCGPLSRLPVVVPGRLADHADVAVHLIEKVVKLGRLAPIVDVAAVHDQRWVAVGAYPSNEHGRNVANAGATAVAGPVDECHHAPARFGAGLR